MAKRKRWRISPKVRRWIIILHRDMGYFFAGVTVLYAISGLAVNHVNDWNPSFIITRKEVPLELPEDVTQVTEAQVRACLGPLDEEGNYLSYDFPSPERIKIYLKHGSIVGHLGAGHGEYETIRKRPILFEANTLHLSPRRWWLVFSDAFAIGLIFIVFTGVLILRGPKGLGGRGKWFVAAGVLIPILAIFLL